MSNAELKSAVLALPEREREELAAMLVATLSEVAVVTDEEALLRDRQLDEGTVQELSHPEFLERLRKVRNA